MKLRGEGGNFAIAIVRTMTVRPIYEIPVRYRLVQGKYPQQQELE